MEILRSEDADSLSQGFSAEPSCDSAISRHASDVDGGTSTLGPCKMMGETGTRPEQYDNAFLSEGYSISANLMSGRLAYSMRRHILFVLLPAEHI